ncbi:monocarboxylate transporter 12-like [Lineus longissimus]|uniref:monocarboxylate transporter 12-like n=1 Tax=Lineus longissimus TaxID=88925 RepID=UPI00315D7040
MVGSILATVGMAMSAFAVNIYHLYFSFGILTGLGVGMSMIPALAMVALYFDKRLSLAVGIALSGGGLSYIVFPMVSAACIRFYTWRGTMFILAAFWAQGCMCGALLRPLESRTTIKDGARKKQVPRPFMCDIGLLRTWQFWFYLLEEYLWHIDFMNFVVILPDFVVLSGHTKEKAAILLTIIGVFVIPSRLLGGLFLDRVSVSPILLLVFGIVTLGTTSLTLPFIKASFIGMAVVCSFRGILHGVLVVFLPKGLVVLFSRDKLTIMIGYVTLFTMFGQLTAPPLGVTYGSTLKSAAGIQNAMQPSAYPKRASQAKDRLATPAEIII